MAQPIGLLALQGDFAMHREAFARLGVATRSVRRPAELADCAGLVLPGGESTTLARLLDRAGLREPLRAFAAERPVLGTCAGLILLASRLDEASAGHGVVPLGLLDCEVRRNGYGRQIDSFQADIALHGVDAGAAPFPGVFIRAPRLGSLGPDVEVLATHGDEPVGVRQGRVIGLAFHPELTADGRLHAAFARLAGAL